MIIYIKHFPVGGDCLVSAYHKAFSMPSLYESRREVGHLVSSMEEATVILTV